MKRTLSLTSVAAVAAITLAACGTDDGGGKNNAEDTQEISVGIAQFVEHPSLDAARKGFVAELESGGYKEGENLTLDVQNASGDQATATNIAANFASADNDLILGIATPTAMSLAQAVTDKPVLFTAVTDPVDAGLVDSMDAPGANITGTTDMNPVADQIKLVKQLEPGAKSVGIIYSSGETNSQIQVDEAKKAAEAEGLKVVEKTVTTTAEVAQAAESFDTDAIYVPTDNKVVAGLEAVISAAEAKKIPLIAGEGDSVERGALATQGLSYKDLGKQTGEMAVKILKDGAKPGEMAVESQKETKLIVNAKAAKAMGVEIPQSLRDKADQVIE